MPVNVLRKIATSIQKAKFFSLMTDEVTDALNKELQVIVRFQSSDETFEPMSLLLAFMLLNVLKLIYLLGS